MTASDKTPDHPVCYGNLDVVFPMGAHGLRNTPDACMTCVCKTECLRAAMARPAGIEVREEMVDRAYASGRLGFFQRWSRRKAFSRQRRRIREKDTT